MKVTIELDVEADDADTIARTLTEISRAVSQHGYMEAEVYRLTWTGRFTYSIWREGHGERR